MQLSALESDQQWEELTQKLLRTPGLPRLCSRLCSKSCKTGRPHAAVGTPVGDDKIAYATFYPDLFQVRVWHLTNIFWLRYLTTISFSFFFLKKKRKIHLCFEWLLRRCGALPFGFLGGEAAAGGARRSDRGRMQTLAAVRCQANWVCFQLNVQVVVPRRQAQRRVLTGLTPTLP